MKIKTFFFKGVLLFIFMAGSINALANDTLRFTLETSGGAISFTIMGEEDKQFTIDWGNDSVETRIGTGYDNITSPIYIGSTYTVTIIGSMAIYFGFSNNHQVSSLKFFDCTVLESLFCPNNDLTSIDVSNCTALKILYCDDSQLTSLNVSDCMALEEIIANQNNLTSIDISDCNALTGLSCWKNNLTNLDVRNYPKLETLLCNKNKLKSLDLSNNTLLTGLDCQDNELTDLDLSSNTLLESLVCYNNQLMSMILNTTELVILFCKENHLPLSVLYNISKNVDGVYYKRLGTQYLPSQNIAINVSYGEGENEFVTGIYTMYSDIKKDSTTAATSDYSISNDGKITFNTVGTYTFTMTNEAITSNMDYPAKVIATIHVNETSITKVVQDRIKVYPNPTIGKLTIDNEQILIEQIILYDLQGRKLDIITNINDYTYILDLQQFVSGMYFLEIKTEKGIITKKIVKE
jgi:hypothetical protein